GTAPPSRRETNAPCCGGGSRPRPPAAGPGRKPAARNRTPGSRRIPGPASAQRKIRLQWCDPALAAHHLLELGAADRDVALVAADLHLRPGLDRPAAFGHPHG